MVLRLGRLLCRAVRRRDCRLLILMKGVIVWLDVRTFLPHAFVSRMERFIEITLFIPFTRHCFVFYIY